MIESPLMDGKTHLTGLGPQELAEFMAGLGEPRYRGAQVFSALGRRRVRCFEQITELPVSLRARLAGCATAAVLTLEQRYLSSDGTRRYLMKTSDGLPVETVFIPEERRDTICFSSQSGCPLQCSFCLTAKMGLLRSLKGSEIVEQIIVALNDAYGEGVQLARGTNLVGMGAGEPLLAFDSLMKALSIIAEPGGLHIVPKRVTISTAGVAPRIRTMAQMRDRPHLAISLSAPDDELRDTLMPINKRWPLVELMSSASEYESSLGPGERLTFEYVMLGGVNDSETQARKLASLLNRHIKRPRVNLIPHNPAAPLPYEPSRPEQLQVFKTLLESKGVLAFIRRPRGRDVFAACGQLAARQYQTSDLVERKYNYRIEDQNVRQSVCPRE